MSVVRQIGLLLSLPMLILSVLALSVGIMVVGAVAYLFLPALAMPLAMAVSGGRPAAPPVPFAGPVVKLEDAKPEAAIAIQPVVTLLSKPLDATRPDTRPEKRAA